MTSKIVIADDEPSILVALEGLMLREGHEVHLAHDGQQALDLLRSERPQLLLLDVNMPRKTGFEVCQHMRLDSALMHIPILMLSGRGREADVVKGLALGANAYMTKPFSPQAVVDKVRALLRSAG